MKILFVNDLAGVNGILCKYLRKAGHECELVNYMQDPFGFTPFYGGRQFTNPDIFIEYLKDAIPSYDIIHLSWMYQLIPQLKKKPIAMHYHGSDIGLNAREAKMFDRQAKLILVAGEQLLQYHDRAVYLPTPVDTELFYSRGEPNKNALIFDIPYCDTDKAIEIFGEGDITVSSRSIPYNNLPWVLSSYQKYVDIKYHKQRGLGTDFSKTGLEALACGLKVLHLNERGEPQWYEGLPEKHRAENVVSSLVSRYEKVLSK